MRDRLMHWMNSHTALAVTLLCAIGYALHALYEMRISIHKHEPIDWYFVSTQALIVFAGAAIAGWAIDLVFTKSEERSGEID